MSVIVVIKEKDRVYIGADSQMNCASGKRTILAKNNYKIWNVKGVKNCVMGHVGEVKDKCVISVMKNLVTKNDVEKHNINYDYVVSKINKRIIKELISYQYISGDKPYSDLSSSFAFAYKNNAYLLHYGAVIEIEDYFAFGSGEDEALGSLATTEGLPAKERIVKAIKASSRYELCVGMPAVITDTLTQEFEVIYE